MTSQLNALIDLLDDPDEKVYVQIKGELMTYGEEIIPMLENTWENTLNKLIQERIEYLIHDIQFNDLLSSFEKHFKASNPELLKAALLIAKYQYQVAFVADQEINLLACLKEIMVECEFK